VVAFVNVVVIYSLLSGGKGGWLGSFIHHLCVRLLAFRF
jgi:hypothetical protein